ncbi:DUF4363 family protein [Maledivibacter halophilus]|uniref:DUF4363 family protein n=1 Tax=Maledivibacter halophilus TaxID=36842 RepID=A0A1T5MAU9_9FIRM|nr:DUF4363 family protein [Maledivibacter halophilus]SKC84978.1 protein of unknown function [Maledivibacter halophilus]
MKSLFISTIVVVILITFWVIIFSQVSESVEILSSLLEDMEDKIYNDNWKSVLDVYKLINDKWTNTSKILMLILDHGEMEKINLALEKLEKYISLKNKSLAIGEAASLKYLLNHIKEKESLSLKNIF